MKIETSINGAHKLYNKENTESVFQHMLIYMPWGGEE